MNQGHVVEPIPLRTLAPWALITLFFLVQLLYMVALDQGALSRSGDLIHEFMHDGRHLLAMPCH